MPPPKPTTCHQCGVKIAQRPNGRPRLYCSSACRQAAYRRRQNVCSATFFDMLDLVSNTDHLRPAEPQTDAPNRVS